MMQDGTRESQELFHLSKLEVRDSSGSCMLEREVQVGFSLEVTYELKYEE